MSGQKTVDVPDQTSDSATFSNCGEVWKCTIHFASELLLLLRPSLYDCMYCTFSHAANICKNTVCLRDGNEYTDPCPLSTCGWSTCWDRGMNAAWVVTSSCHFPAKDSGPVPPKYCQHIQLHIVWGWWLQTQQINDAMIVVHVMIGISKRNCLTTRISHYALHIAKDLWCSLSLASPCSHPISNSAIFWQKTSNPFNPNVDWFWVHCGFDFSTFTSPLIWGLTRNYRLSAQTYGFGLRGIGEIWLVTPVYHLKSFI